MKLQSADRLTGCYGYRLILDTGLFTNWTDLQVLDTGNYIQLGWLTDCMVTML